MPESGISSDPYFPGVGLNTKIYRVNQENMDQKISGFGHFSHIEKIEGKSIGGQSKSIYCI